MYKVVTDVYQDPTPPLLPEHDRCNRHATGVTDSHTLGGHQRAAQCGRE